MKKPEFDVVKEIHKGWSNDKKYCVIKDNKKYLLRLSKIETYKSKSVEFVMMKKASALNIPMCQPLDFGILGNQVYMLQSWIEGNDFEEVIDQYSKHEQYDLGIKAGLILKKIHHIQAPEDIERWEVRYNRKIEQKIKNYQACPIKYKNGDLFLSYIQANRKLLDNRPQSYLHGDYHLGNFMIDNQKQLIIIDFNRSDFGDPWEEFNRIVWSAQRSWHFASGMVDGYFNDEVPLAFWKILLLYISTNTISSLPWAIAFGDDQVKIMEQQATDILKWYDNMKNVIPKWYNHISLKE